MTSQLLLSLTRRSRRALALAAIAAALIAAQFMPTTIARVAPAALATSVA
jgi:hypothetical protein